jgi:hypothetical protein
MRTLPKLNDLIAQARATLQELDDLDLDSDNPTSVADFKKLESEYREDTKALVEFIEANAAAILAELA